LQLNLASDSFRRKTLSRVVRSTIGIITSTSTSTVEVFVCLKSVKKLIGSSPVWAFCYDRDMKTVVITGASQGLGLTIANVFFKGGWHVMGTGRSARPDALDPKIEYAQFDASDAAASASFWKELRLDDGEVCLVNNAGGYVSGRLLETQSDDYNKQMLSSYFSSVYMTRGLAENVGVARIINVVSTSALAAHPKNSAYGAAKAATMHFFQSIKQEFPPDKYQITNLYPSDIASHGVNPDAINPNDLAHFIVELAQSQASYYLTDVTMYPVKRSA
jgi:short-subunit dehydrogenase